MRILHLSDLHFNCNDINAVAQRQVYFDDFIEKVSEIRKTSPIDFIVISGDLVYKCCDYDKKLEKFFADLKVVLDFDDGFDRFLVCPGNHDYQRVDRKKCRDEYDNSKKSYLDAIKNEDKGLTIGKLEENERSFSKYIEFCRNVGLREYTIGGNLSYLLGSRQVEGYNLVCINTAWYTQFSSKDRKEYLGSEYAAAIMNDLKGKSGYTLTVLHHPLEYWNESERCNYTGFRNTLSLIDEFSDIVFHGHTHETLNVVRYYGPKRVPFVGSGAFLAKDTPLMAFYEYEFTMDTPEGKRYLYTYNSGWIRSSKPESVRLSSRRMPGIFERPFEIQKHQNGFFGRDEIVKTIVKDIEEQACSLYVVYGAPGVGKTEVCRAVLNNMVRSRWAPRQPILLQGKSGFEGLISALGDALKLKPENQSADEIYTQLKLRCDDAPSLLYLDNFEDVLPSSRQQHGDVDEYGSPIEQQQNIIDKRNRVYKFLKLCGQISGLRMLISCRERLEVEGVKELNLDCLGDNEAFSLFRRGWGAEIIDNMSRKSKEREIKLRDFIKNELANHPLTIVIASGQKTRYEIEELLDDWRVNSGRMYKVGTDDPTHYSLIKALDRSYRIIESEELCREIWAIASFCEKSIQRVLFDGLFPAEKQELRQKAQKAMEKLIQMNLIFEDKEDGMNYAMLPPIKQRIFEVSDCALEIYNSAVKRLATFYRDKLENTFPERDNWEENSRNLVPFVKDILFFMWKLLSDSDLVFSELLFLHERMANFYQTSVSQAILILDQLINRRGSMTPIQYADTLWMRGDMARLQNHNTEAVGYYMQSKNISSELGTRRNKWSLAQANRKLGDIKRNEAKYAAPLLEEAESQYKDLEEFIGYANTVKIMADVKRSEQDWKEAKQLYEKALFFYNKENDKQGKANVLSWLGEINRRNGKIQEAIGSFEDGLKLYEEIGNERGQGNIYQGLGDLYQATGDYIKAGENYIKAIKNYEQDRDSYKGESCTWGELCIIYALLGKDAQARKGIDKARTEVAERVLSKKIDNNIADYVRSRIEAAEKILDGKQPDEPLIDKIALPRDFAKYTEALPQK